MKTQRFLISLFTVFIITASTVFANENKAVATARSEIISNLNDVMEKIPFNECLGSINECKMTIVFHVNENSELINYQISSNNESLNHFAEVLLKKAELTTEPVLNGKNFHIIVTFKNKAYH